MTVRYFNCDYFHWYSVYFATSGDNEHGGQPVLED